MAMNKIVSDELLKKLRSAFNLNIYEARVWVALLSKGVATAGELSDMSDVPRSRSYDVLESLEKKGFVIMKLGRPIKYLAVRPEEIVKRVKKSLQEKVEDEIKMVDQIQGTDVFKELNLLFKNGIDNVDPASIAGSFKGRDNIYDHLTQLLNNAEKEVIIVTTNEGLLRKLDHFKSTFKKLKAKNVSIKIAAPLNTDKTKQITEEYKDLCKIKNIDMNARFVIIDAKDILFMVNHDKNLHQNSDVGIWVSTPFFASALNTMFESVWEK